MPQTDFPDLPRSTSNGGGGKSAANKSKPAVSIIGCGSVGVTLAILLAKKGYGVVSLYSRQKKRAQETRKRIGQGRVSSKPAAAARGNIIFLTTPDDSIREVARCIAREGRVKEKSIFLHCSGNFSSHILAPLKKRGAFVASLHPLKSFVSPSEAARTFPGTFCFYEGDREVRGNLCELIKDLGGIPVEVDRAGKVLYHAGASMVSNFSVALMASGVELLAASGVERGDAFSALLTLLKGTVQNLEKTGLPAALTGPIARGDASVIASHVKELSKEAPHLLPLYRILGKQTIQVAREKGTLSSQAEKKLRKILGEEKSG